MIWSHGLEHVTYQPSQNGKCQCSYGRVLRQPFFVKGPSRTSTIFGRPGLHQKTSVAKGGLGMQREGRGMRREGGGKGGEGKRRREVVIEEGGGQMGYGGQVGYSCPVDICVPAPTG